MAGQGTGRQGRKPQHWQLQLLGCTGHLFCRFCLGTDWFSCPHLLPREEIVMLDKGEQNIGRERKGEDNSGRQKKKERRRV